MTKKVIELANEMGISTKELIDQAVKLGIKAKTPASIIKEQDAKKIKEAIENPAAAKKKVGRPIVDQDFLSQRHHMPVSKPVVDENTFHRKNKEEEPLKEEAKAKAQDKPEEKTVKTAASDAEAVKTEEPEKTSPSGEKSKKTEAKAEPLSEEKPEEKKETKPASLKTEAKAENKEPEKKKREPKKESDKPLSRASSTKAKAQEKPASEVTSAHEAAKKAEKPEKAELKKAPETKKAETKKEPEIKLAESEKVRAPRIKIVKRAEDVKKAEEERRKKAKAAREQRKNEHSKRQADSQRTGNRNGQRRKNAGAASQNAPERKRSHHPSAPAEEGRPQQEQGSRGNRASRRGHRSDSGFSKFDKLEKKSLEKKERKKYTNKQKQEAQEEVPEEVLPEGTFKLDVPITIAGFCEQTEVSTSKVIMTLMKMGIMANINQNLDEDTVLLLADELGIKVVVGKVEEEVKEEGIEDFKDDEKDLVPRAPIITVMGHVDHGKTSLLDAIRKTHVTEQESGGITQAIGASEVKINGKRIVFLDTPGHEAFTAMRARGAHITDIAVLVVAADDGVMPQTIESISHAKAANVPIIVAINKMDKPGANPDRVKKELADQGVLVEDWGGDVISVPLSAKTGEGINDLLEMILLQADVLELKANPNRLAMGSVIEASLDKSRGPVATLLVMNGTLHKGQSIVAGTCSGRIRMMTDSHGNEIYKAGPATAVEILGLTDVPEAGDEFNAVRDDKTAREIAGRRAEKLREETMAKNSSMTLEKLFSEIKEGEVKELNLIIKADVQGSVGAIISSLEKLNNDQVKVNIIHSGVGTVNESDVMLAETSNAVIIGFNVRPSAAVSAQADRDGVEIRLYRVIYDAINDVEAAMKGMLEPDVKEEVLGQAEVRDTFKVPGVGVVAGAYVTSGKMVRNAEIRLVRNGIVIHEGKISSLKRFKDDAKEVLQNFECGIGIEDYNDIKVEDVIECFHMVEVEKDSAL